MAYGFTEKQATEYDRWKTTAPEEYYPPECPECDAVLEKDDDGYKCSNCGYSIYPDFGGD